MRTHTADAIHGYQWLDELQQVQAKQSDTVWQVVDLESDKVFFTTRESQAERWNNDERYEVTRSPSRRPMAGYTTWMLNSETDKYSLKLGMEKPVDFSHLHALEERAIRIRTRMIAVQKNDAQWKAQAVQLFQTEKEIADEREFLGLEDMSTDDLYAGLIEEHESEVVRKVTALANAAEQAAAIRTAAEAVIEHFYTYRNCECGVPVSMHGVITSCSLSAASPYICFSRTLKA